MKMDLSEIFYFDKDTTRIEKEINELLTKYELDHEDKILVTDGEFIRIETVDTHQLVTGLLKSPIRRTYRYIDLVSILFQYYVTSNTSIGNSYSFIRDINKVVLTRTDAKNFHYDKLLKEKNPAVIFHLLTIPFYMEITDSNIADEIKMVTVYNMNQTNIDEYDKSLFVPVVKNKALKSTGDIYISLLYQMMLYTHYYFSFIKGSSAWDNI